MPYTANMTPEQVAEYDQRRMLGDTGPYTNSNFVIRKQPWLNLDGTHKAQDTETTMPLPEKREGESEFQRQIRHWQEKVKDDPKKYSGGKDQAIAIAAEEAGVAKKADTREASQREQSRRAARREREVGEHYRRLDTAHMGKSPHIPPVDECLEPLKKYGTKACPSDDDKKDDKDEFIERLFGKNILTSAPAPAGMKMPAGSKTGMAQVGGTGAPLPAKAPSMGGVSKPPGVAAYRGGPSPESQLPLKSANAQDEDTMKALTTRSMYIMRPLNQYDPYGVQRSANTIPVHKGSVLEPYQTSPIPMTITKSCFIHGITYDVKKGCHPCTLHKSTLCKQCGTAMVKQIGGSIGCPSGH